MLILAVDTSGRNGSVALCRGAAAGLEVLGLAALEGGAYSARLIPSIADLLQRASVTKWELDGFVVVDGPGSFTGLRVGLATVKGLCEVLRRPLAAVSMLEALAITYGDEARTVVAIMDAGRGEVYMGEFEVRSQRAEAKEQVLVKLSELASHLPARSSHIVSTLARVGETLALSGIIVETVLPLDATAIARIGLRKLLAGDTVDPATLDANYIRRSDAELFSPPKR